MQACESDASAQSHEASATRNLKRLRQEIGDPENLRLKNLARYGSSLQWAWACMVLIGSNLVKVPLGQPQSIECISLAQPLVSIIAFAILGFYSLRHRNLFARKALSRAVAVLGFAGTFFMVSFASCADSLVSTGCFLAGTVASSACAAVSLLLWSEFYSQFPLKKALWYVAASLAAGSGLGFVANLLPSWITAACALAALPLNALLLPIALNPSQAETDEAAAERASLASKPRSLAKMLPVFFAYGISFDFAWGLSFGGGQTAYELASMLGMIAVTGTAVFFAILFRFAPDSFRLDNAVRLVLPFVGAALAVVAVMGAISGPIAYGLTKIGEQIFGIALWIMLLSACQCSDRSAVAVFALGRGVNHLGRLIGLALGATLAFYPETDSTLLVAISFIVLFALIVANNFTVGKETHSVLDNQATNNNGLGEQSIDSDDGVRCRCAQLAEREGLTPRESEILTLLAKGRSAPRIASELVISEGTVKTHIHHIYDKTGAKNRQELLDLIDCAQ